MSMRQRVTALIFETALYYQLADVLRELPITAAFPSFRRDRSYMVEVEVSSRLGYLGRKVIIRRTNARTRTYVYTHVYAD